jgi:DNA polymerase/3'-5' exonuclease PolX
VKLAHAKAIADKYVALLTPFCDRIEIAGSIRREQPEVGDIEIVCIPTVVDARFGLFDVRSVPHPGFVAVVNDLEKVKGEPTGKYTQRILPEGIKLDLFMAEPDNWGLIFAIRTGSAEYSHKILARQWCRRGFNSKGGFLVKAGKIYPVREERDLFAMIGLVWLDPQRRL